MGPHQRAAPGAASVALDGLHRLHEPGFLPTRFSFAHIAWMSGTKKGEEFCGNCVLKTSSLVRTHSNGARITNFADPMWHFTKQKTSESPTHISSVWS